MPADDLYALFPHLKDSQHQLTSDADNFYNCIAWAARDVDHKWWPFAYPPYGYWPDGVPRDDTIAGFVAAFETLGYLCCDDGGLEIGFEKLAIYVDATGTVTHMARQLADGAWTSKLGDLEDIEHGTVEAVYCDLYGTVGGYMKRPAS